MTYTAKLKGISPLSFGKAYEAETVEEKALQKKSAAQYEEATFRRRIHVGKNGSAVIPGTFFRGAIIDAAQFLGERVPGKGQATYSKHFLSSVLVLEDHDLGIKPEDMPYERLFVPADGMRGGSKRVFKCFPYITEWSATVEFTVLDNTITEEVFTRTLEAAGQCIGIGRWRPRKGGQYGRFDVVSVKVS